MARRHGPLFESLTYDKAPEADRVIRPQAVDSHQGPERDRSSNRPDRFVHPSRRPQKIALRRETSIDCRSVSDRPHRGANACLSASFAELDRGIPRLQGFILGPQRRYQRDQVFRGRHARRFANRIRILELETAYAVQENLSLTIAVAQPGQLPFSATNEFAGPMASNTSSPGRIIHGPMVRPN